MRRIVIALGLALGLALAACSSKPPRTGGGNGHGGAPVDAAPATAGGDGGATSLTHAQCDRIIDHAVAVLNDELRASKPEDEWPTEEQLDAVRVNMATEFMEECQQYEQYVYDCMMAAKDSPGLARCAEEPAL